MKKLIFLFIINSIYVSGSNSEFYNQLSSKNILINKFWSNNYGVNITKLNPLIQSTLQDINILITEQSLHSIELYRIKHPIDSLFRFEIDNITGVYKVTPFENKINISDSHNKDALSHLFEKNKINRKNDLQHIK